MAATTLSIISEVTDKEIIGRFFEGNDQPTPTAVEKNKWQTFSNPDAKFSVITDPYGGVHVELSQNLASLCKEKLRESIAKLSEELAQTKDYSSVWIHFPNPVTLNSLAILPDSFQAGAPGKSDIIQDLQQEKLKAWQWVKVELECTIPPGATHNIGAVGLLIHEHFYFEEPAGPDEGFPIKRVVREVLLVQNIRRSKDWNVPGGSYDLHIDQSPRDTAWRELKEETGIETTSDLDALAVKNARFCGMLEFPKNQFAKALNLGWAFFINELRQAPLNPPQKEILQARWFNTDEILSAEGTLGGLNLGSDIQRFVATAINGLAHEQIFDKGWMIAYSAPEQKPTSPMRKVEKMQIDSLQ